MKLHSMDWHQSAARGLGTSGLDFAVIMHSLSFRWIRFNKKFKSRYNFLLFQHFKLLLPKGPTISAKAEMQNLSLYPRPAQSNLAF